MVNAVIAHIYFIAMVSVRLPQQDHVYWPIKVDQFHELIVQDIDGSKSIMKIGRNLGIQYLVLLMPLIGKMITF